MSEFINILKDIKTGALPLRELPGFVLWGVGHMGWFWFVLMIILLFVRR